MSLYTFDQDQIFTLELTEEEALAYNRYVKRNVVKYGSSVWNNENDPDYEIYNMVREKFSRYIEDDASGELLSVRDVRWQKFISKAA